MIPALYKLSTSSSFDEPEQRHAIVLLVLVAVLRAGLLVVASERRSGARAGYEGKRRPVSDEMRGDSMMRMKACVQMGVQ